MSVQTADYLEAITHLPPGGRLTLYEISWGEYEQIIDRLGDQPRFRICYDDGRLEIVVNNMNDTPSLLKNRGEAKNWILIKTVGTKSNRDGIGARVTVISGALKQMDEVRSGGSYISHNDLRLHFGIGDATKVDRAEVMWPSGRKEFFQNLKANQVVTLEEGKGTALGGNKKVGALPPDQMEKNSHHSGASKPQGKAVSAAKKK